MKVEIVGSKCSKFPRLRRLKAYPGTVVLFIDDTTGVALSVEDGSPYIVGTFSENWRADSFEDLPEGLKIVLSN